MESFIEAVVKDINKEKYAVEELCIVIPSKRASVFLRQELSKLLEQPIFAPQIISIEEFVEGLSGLRKVSDAELVFRFYNVYTQNSELKEIESFESFSKWAQIILQDFNEVDRYLTPPEKIFNYLRDIKAFNHWSLEDNQTDLIKRHLEFWSRLYSFYKILKEKLVNSGMGYQGLIYREATVHIEAYIESNRHKKHIFLGFNALNSAESIILQELLQNDSARIYWDTDEVFFNDSVHDAGLFLRQYESQWKFFRHQEFKWILSNYRKQKEVKVIGIPKLVGQAKYVGQLLLEIQKTNKDLSNVAVVLADEQLLIPVLNSLPNSVAQVNVTMGLPLRLIPLASLFDKLFN